MALKNKSKTLSVGLIGCGHLGSVHCRILNEIVSADKSVEFAGVFDIVKDKAAKLANAHGLKAFNSLEELLGAVDTLIIVTPTSTHFNIASGALEKDINLFIEKPVTGSSEEAAKLIGLSKNSGAKIQVGHVERFNPALTSLNKYSLNPLFIESHRLAQFNPRGTDVSVIQDLMIHDIDIILSIVKAGIKRIDANGVGVISESVDIANARISFENGCVANLTASRISPKKMRKMRIFQPNSYISIDFLNNISEVFRLVSSSDTKPAHNVIPLHGDKLIMIEKPHADPESGANPIKEELLSFFESISADKPVKVTLEEGRRAVEVAGEIIKIIGISSGGNKIS